MEIDMKKIIAIFLCLSLMLVAVACGGEASESSESVAKPSRDGFDASTNQELEVGGLVFFVPDYLDFEENENGDYEAMLETDHGLISIASSDSTFTEEEFTSNKVDYIKEWNEMIKCETTDDDGSFVTTNDSGVKITGKSDMIFNSDNGKLIILYIMQSENAEYDYMSDFNAIVDSAHKVDNSVESNDSDSSDNSGGGDRPETDISPEFKETMDSYEAFFDEYVEFMNNYDANTSDPELLMEYAELMSKEADMLQKMEAMDESDMTTAEAAYYLEVTARIEAKLATVAY